ncbi:MAG: RidA family protein [Sphingopyxis sp.]|uniref:RidA family protein n=1 Tax=Sphingopyxis sp. TaxID=1908224 RepID=UPI002AB87B65|nr:RidA family protein [Sphingopyxis sp.]MDZ3831816.1 RidA family protein [Sphingopyxis sp.]
MADAEAAACDRATLSSASPYEPLYGYSRAVRTGNRITVAGTAPIEPDGSSTIGDAEVQAARCLAIIFDALAALGGSPADVVRTRMFITDAADADRVGRAHGAVFGEIRPAATMVVVAALLRPEWKVEIEAEAILPHKPTPAWR